MPPVVGLIRSFGVTPRSAGAGLESATTLGAYGSWIAELEDAPALVRAVLSWSGVQPGCAC
jgi:hypothetical protein